VFTFFTLLLPFFTEANAVTEERAKLQPYAKINFPEINEASGIVKSRMWPDVYWIHNDSGDEARIFPITRKGEIIKPEWMKDYRGIEIPDAVNVDWESITTDDRGNLIIADCGNNSNTRRDLAIYIVKEPYPTQTVVTRVARRILYYYPDQKGFPPEEKNFDAEAVFWHKGKIYILTKHRSDTFTKLYRLDSTDPLKENPAVLVRKFDIQGQVSGADISEDGRKLAVLTNDAVWLFETAENSDDFFSGKKYRLPYKDKQCGAICFDNHTLILLNEPGNLYELKIDDLIRIK
jgi:hypothetical protein